MITIDHVTFSYHRNNVFKELDLHLDAGNIYGLLGKNGAGKTTLLKLIAGLLTPKSGNITVDGLIPAKRSTQLLSEVFILLEEFDLPRISIIEYAKYYGVFYPHFSTEELLNLLKEFEVDPQQSLHAMSFGQKKKAYIAFAIACNTKLLIMDEPTNGLDIPSKGSFRRVMASIVNNNRSIIISTHQVRDLDKLIDHIVILDESEILLNTSTNNITDKLLFTHLDNEQEALYSEQTIHGRWGIVLNKEQDESSLDLELLFNLTTSNRETIKQIFSHE